MDHKAVIKSASIYNTKKTELVAAYKNQHVIQSASTHDHLLLKYVHLKYNMSVYAEYMGNFLKYFKIPFENRFT